MEFGQLFHVLRSRWWLLVSCSLLVLAATVGYRLVAPGSYKGVASVVIDPRGINPVSGVATQEPMAQDSVIGTYANIARSEGVARQVVSDLGANGLGALAAQWSATHSGGAGFGAWAARRLLKGLDVRAGGQNSHVLDISFQSKDPAEAARLANAFAQAVIQYAKSMRVAPAEQNAAYFATQASELQRQAIEAERRLAAFQRQHGITSADERADVETARLAALSSQVVVNQTLAYDSATRSRAAAAGSVLPDVLNNALIQNLSTELSEREASLQELSSRLGGNHPEIQAARTQVEEARSVLARESKKVAASLETNNSMAASRGASLRGDSEQQRRKVVELASLRVELAALDREVTQKRKLFEMASLRSTETALNASNQQDDVKLLTQAFPPEERNGPGAAVTIPLAVIVGLLIGTLIAVGLDKLSPRLYRIQDIESMGIEVLTAIPVIAVRSARNNGPQLAAG